MTVVDGRFAGWGSELTGGKILDGRVDLKRRCWLKIFLCQRGMALHNIEAIEMDTCDKRMEHFKSNTGIRLLK